jgi:hypothetical protein
MSKEEKKEQEFQKSLKNLKPKRKFKLGVIGEADGKCCRGWCLDCEIIRKKYI